MKTLTVERKRNGQHIIGQELNESYSVKNEKDVHVFIGHLLESLDGETYDFYNDDIKSIYNLQNGFYDINDGDVTLYITVSDDAE